MTIPLGFAQVNVKVTGLALPTGAQFTFGVSNQSDWTPTEIANYVIVNWDTAVVQAFFSSQTSITSVLVKKGPDDVGPSAEVGCNMPGLSSATSVPPNVAILVHKHTGAGGRQGRGRMYLPGWVEGVVDSGGLVDPTLRANLETNLEDFRAKMEVDDMQLVVLHGDFLVPYPINELSVDARVATQRRRLRR